MSFLVLYLKNTINVQYLENVIFSIEKSFNGQSFKEKTPDKNIPRLGWENSPHHHHSLTLNLGKP